MGPTDLPGGDLVAAGIADLERTGDTTPSSDDS
jgi:hypothetical protein